jgi:hypothetical protein
VLRLTFAVSVQSFSPSSDHLADNLFLFLAALQSSHSNSSSSTWEGDRCLKTRAEEEEEEEEEFT